jgi:hypothetical protein
VSLGEISVTIQAVNEASPTFEAIGSDAASMASAVSSSPMILNVENLASPQINQVAEDAATVKAQVEATPITISFAPVEVPVIPPIDVSPIQTSFSEVGVAASEMGANVEAAGTSFDDLGTQAEATTVKLTTVARGISSVSSLGLGITTLGTDFGFLDSQSTKYVRDALAVITVVSEVARVISYSTLMTQGHTASVTIDTSSQAANAASTVAATGAMEGQAEAVALDTSTETASASASLASTVATNIKTAATWLATTAENALNISQATFLALTGVGIAVIIAAAAAVAYFASQMNSATSSVQNFNSAATDTTTNMKSISRVGEQALYRQGVEGAT